MRGGSGVQVFLDVLGCFCAGWGECSHWSLLILVYELVYIGISLNNIPNPNGIIKDDSLDMELSKRNHSRET